MDKIKPKDKPHYVNGKEFYDAMVVFLEDRKADSSCRIPPFVGECIYKICSKIVYMPNFINYSFRDEMEGQALEHCIKYIDRFNPEKGTNAFAYFSQIAYFACVQVINKEKKVMDIKAKFVQSGSLYYDMIDSDDDDTAYFDPESISTLEYLYKYDLPKQKKTASPSKTNLDKFL